MARSYPRAQRGSSGPPPAAGTWLCPNPGDRERLLELHRFSRPARLATLAVVGAGTVLLAVDWGWGVFGVFAGVTVVRLLLEGRMLRSPRPEIWFFAATLLTMAGIGLGTAMTGGPHSAVLPWLLVPAVGAAAVLANRGVLVVFAWGAGMALLGSLTWRDAAPPNVQILLSTLVLMVVVAFDVGTLMRAEARSRRGSIIDPLTGLLNRSTLDQRFLELREQALVAGRPVAIVVFDLDHFKTINDEHGHDTGDRVLRDVARTVRVSLRSFELAYRIGGEEFLVLLPGLDEAGAARRAEQVREALLATRPAGLRVTLSAGVAAGLHDGELDFQSLYEEADQRLYVAKQRGRNRVVPEPVDPGPVLRRSA
ncbi:unannotated protein [freshwater metagenome]|uniref:Unannotated protein n=1 Tax=freshwater metagenome TaxID=449393 RepID=A0A6J7ECD3_9ZZZZ